MEDQINERLIEAKKDVRSAEKFQSMLRDAQQRLADEKKKHTRIKKVLAEEKSDVDKLEGLSLTGLFYSVLGRKEWHLDKERSEYLAALLKFDSSEDSLRDANEEADRLGIELEKYSGAAKVLESTLKEKENYLLHCGDERGKQMLLISEEMGNSQSDQKELKEAVSAGNSALNALNQVHSSLKSASNWGTFDMLGGGIISTAVKHNKIDAAKQHAHRAQRKLKRFQSELADAGERLKVSIDMDGFSKFADFFFDGLIIDWMVQSKITNASKACARAQRKVQSAVSACEQRLKETDLALKDAHKKRMEFLEKG